ncbi:DUF2309 domain-containing protein [Fulvivirga sp. 29W222]|uniref:Probable inorganic carbon transporter subunit DabA n=1 Tax=Fulvivirga marina TaxID=2494733 RepID=A0A937KF17_9BACT|nr:DUF2309 domain-containing protein [Fulvivirga marina]MBL6447738.1 DUF2309 domain-containing protein [Fulvivirga marina]
MESIKDLFDEHDVLHKLKHYLPAQASLKDFVHHNTLHAFQHLKFHEALHQASQIFGYKTYLSLAEFRALFQEGKIREDVLDNVIQEKKGESELSVWKERLLQHNYSATATSRVGRLRVFWKEKYKINLDKIVHPFLFKLLSAYLDQGISIWAFPVDNKDFLNSIREMEQNELISIFKTSRPRKLLMEGQCSLKSLLKILVGDEELFEQYLFDQQFSHPGWAGMVSVIEHQPETLLDRRTITLHDLIYLELLLEIDALDHKFGQEWEPIGSKVAAFPDPLFQVGAINELEEVLILWQEAFEWSYYDDVLKGVSPSPASENDQKKSFQALFCIDDREYSLRRYIESVDNQSDTFGTPGFFGVEFFFQPEHSKFYTKACPAPVTPKYLIREEARRNSRQKDPHYTKRSHLPFQGWLITQTLGFWSALKLFLNIFKPSISPATSYSFQHMDKHSRLSIENEGEQVDGMQVGFTVEEMAERVGNTLRSIGLVKDFAPLIYVVGHGASSVNNTHYAGYDCGACCGRPGAVNARVFSYMANLTAVREQLRKDGLDIPEDVVFVGAMHDTTRDEIEFYDEEVLTSSQEVSHQHNQVVFEKALALNAKERSRRFDTVNTQKQLAKLHKDVKRRSVSLFEPRPELNHATNSLCIVGRGSLTKNVFLDRRPFMNSYDYRIDPEGKYLLTILNAAAPVCGGINLEYYFSRVDNEKLGAGTKLPHNVIGLFAVANGVDGDLRPGLPSQMIEVHDPIRLMFVVEHYPDVVLKTIQANPATYEWFINEWVYLVVKDPETGQIYKFFNGEFKVYQTLRSTLQKVSDVNTYIENYLDNIPVLITD